MSKTKIGIIIVVLVIILAALWKVGAFGYLKPDGYQAVFLSNNQVYFGKVANQGSQFVRLTDIFYLQVQQPVQPIGDEPASQNLALIKLGEELHKPVDEMKINRDHILFIEDLKPDSQIVEKINEFYASQEAAP